MSKTREQLANRALDKLRIVGLGQSPEAEDTEKMDGIIDSFDAWVSSVHIYTIADIDEIEEDAFEWLADLLAWFGAPDFSKTREDAMKMTAERELNRITASRPTYQVLETEYF